MPFSFCTRFSPCVLARTLDFQPSQPTDYKTQTLSPIVSFAYFPIDFSPTPMDIARLERVNEGRIRRFKTVGHKPRRLVLHPVFRNFISRLTNVSDLSKSFEKIHFLDSTFQFVSDSCYAFLIPPEIPVVQMIADLRTQVGDRYTPFIELWFQPRVSDVILAFMVETEIAPLAVVNTFPSEHCSAASRGSVGRDGIEIYNLEIDLIPVDDDVVTLASPYAFLRLWHQKDLTVVDEVRHVFDRIPEGFLSVAALGQIATVLARDLTQTADSTNHLIVIDRTADILTPLVTQMNYEGLIAEFIGIDCGCTSCPGTSELQLLSSKTDALFRDIRALNHQEATMEIDRRMRVVSGALTHHAPTFEEGVEHFRRTVEITKENQTVAEHIALASELMRCMKAHPYFRRIINVEAAMLQKSPSKVKELIAEMLEDDADLVTVVRMCCLESVLRGGSHDYQKLLSALTFNFGAQMIPFAMRLQSTGLFVPEHSGVKWSALLKPLNAFVSDFEQVSDQAAASYLGFVPLTVRYVQRIIAGDLPAVQKAMSHISHPFSHAGPTGSKSDGTVIVLFLGGCTHSELNSLRRIREQQKVQIQIITTDLFSSNTFFENLAHDIPAFETRITS
jgi:hypothetical protein